MKRLLPFLIIYVLVHSIDGDSVRAYEGQPSSVISTLLTAEGKTGDFITQQQFEDFIVAHTPPPPTPAEILSTQRAQAIDDLNAGAQPATKLQRAVFLVTLDEINVLRSLLVPAQPPRTVTQFKNAVQAKINSGAAD